MANLLRTPPNRRSRAPENEPPDASMHQCSGTQHARLQGDVYGCVFQSVVRSMLRGLLDGKNLGVRG